MIIAGDLFHTRGIIDPEVLNPLRDTITKILALGMEVNAIPGKGLKYIRFQIWHHLRRIFSFCLGVP